MLRIDWNAESLTIVFCTDISLISNGPNFQNLDEKEPSDDVDTSADLVEYYSFGDNFRNLKQHFTERPPKVHFVYVIHTYARYLSSKTAGFPQRKEFFVR